MYLHTPPTSTCADIDIPREENQPPAGTILHSERVVRSSVYIQARYVSNARIAPEDAYMYDGSTRERASEQARANFAEICKVYSREKDKKRFYRFIYRGFLVGPH